MSIVLGGVCDLCSETRGGQYFATEGREIEGPPPKDVFGSFPNMLSSLLHAIAIKPLEQVFPGSGEILIDLRLTFNGCPNKNLYRLVS